MSECEHIWNAHRQCQWCHRDRRDVDYDDGMRDARDLLLLVSPGVTPMESLSGLVSQLNNYIAGLKSCRDEALAMAAEYGQIDGSHHKAWVIDQMVRRLTGDSYEQFVAEQCDGDDGPDTYSWDEGIAP